MRFLAILNEKAVKIAKILRGQGKTQRDLARALGKSESEISKWFTGLHNLELRTIYKIEAALGEEVIEVTCRNLCQKTNAFLHNCI